MKLEFGTAGIRGIVGNTDGQLNEAHAAQIFHGLAKYLNSKFQNIENKIIIIGRDNRIKGKKFALLAANILTSYGIKVFFSDQMIPTPFISFLIKNKKALGGINITASHNPKEYNGIKLYNHLGYQMLPNEIKELKEQFLNYDQYKDLINDEEIKLNHSSLIEPITEEDKRQYIEQVLLLNQNKNNNLSNLKIVYSALHGTGYEFIHPIFNQLKANVIYEPNENVEDENFTYVENPNPESHVAFKNSLVLAKKEEADLIIITDPDSDRIGVAYLDENHQYQFINGNENAILITNYLLETTELDHLKENYLIYSLVSTSLPAKMCATNYINSYSTQTGFKWIGKLIKEKKEAKLFFAFEESYGSLINPNISLDKDAIQGTLIIALIAAKAKHNNMNLGNLLKSIYQKYGFLKTQSFSFDLLSNDQLNKVKELFKRIEFNDSRFVDYNQSNDESIKNDMLAYYFHNSLNWIALRPSGTEPKFKIYLHIVEKTEKDAELKFNKLLQIIKNKLQIN